MNASDNDTSSIIKSFEETTTATLTKPSMDVLIGYMIGVILLAIAIMIGNGIIILVFCMEKALRKKTNYYIVSLAVADFFVGLSVVVVVTAGLLNQLENNLIVCIFTKCLVVSLCVVSIFNLIGISLDRYWATIKPIQYSQKMGKRETKVIICACWILGCTFGFMPLFGWHKGSPDNNLCNTATILDPIYLLILSIGMIIIPSIILLFLNGHIYIIISRRLNKGINVNEAENPQKEIGHGKQDGLSLHLKESKQQKNIKAAKTLSFIVIFYIFSWTPFGVFIILSAFCPDCYYKSAFYFFAAALTHLNSALNPILYAYHLKGFKDAFKKLCIQRSSQSITINQSP